MCSQSSFAQQLQITSPTPATIVNPGQLISVSVSSPAGTSFSTVAVAAQSPLISSSVVTSVPAQLSVTVPLSVPLGPYALTATGVTADGKRVQSRPILVDVERPDSPTSVAADPSRISLRSAGQTIPLQVSATFSDNSVFQVTRSSLITFTSLNSGVATIDQNGVVTAIAQGSTTVTVSYAAGGQNLTASVAVTVRPPVTTSRPTSLDFGSLNIESRSGSQTLTITNVSTNDALRVGPVVATGDFFETDNCAVSSPLPEGGMCTVNVLFTPSSTGFRTGIVQVANSIDIVPLRIPVNGTGIGQPTTTTAIVSSSPNPSVFGQPVMLTVTVNVSGVTAAPTGSITFSDNTNTLDTETLANNQATFTTSSLAAGTHSITASYGGDSNFLGSTSAALSQVVNQASTSTTLTASANPATVSSSISLTASLSVVAPGAGTPTGSISFQDGTNSLATVPVNASGQATFSTAALSVGTHSLSASYGGDARFKASSGALNEQIAYAICVLYDQTRSVNSGATFPIKLYLCDGNGNDLSSSSVILHATGVSNLSGFSGPVQSPGNANPDNDFRYDATLGPSGGYIFNLGTSGLASGTFSLHFTAGADPVTHAVNFGVK